MLLPNEALARKMGRAVPSALTKRILRMSPMRRRVGVAASLGVTAGIGYAGSRYRKQHPHAPGVPCNTCGY